MSIFQPIRAYFCRIPVQERRNDQLYDAEVQALQHEAEAERLAVEAAHHSSYAAMYRDRIERLKAESSKSK